MPNCYRPSRVPGHNFLLAFLPTAFCVALVMSPALDLLAVVVFSLLLLAGRDILRAF